MRAISDEISSLVVADTLQGSRNVKNGCRQDTGKQKPDLVEHESRSKLLKADSQANQEMMNKKDEEHMMAPTQLTAHLVMVKINEPTTGLALDAPLGRFKGSSGNTFKEQGQAAMDFYTRTETIYVNHG